MPDMARYGLMVAVIFLTHFQEGITGFGCTVLALPFITLLLGLKVAVPMLVLQGWLLAVLIVLESRKKIVWGEFARILLPMCIGLPVGMWMSRSLPEAGLKWVLAGFMVAVGTQGLISHLRGATPPAKMSPKTRFVASLFLPIGGIIHGAFGSGGPLLVIYATRALTDKTLFRVTLCMVWTVLGAILIAQWLVSSSLTPQVWKVTGICLPFTLLGLVLGNRAHYRIDETTFRKVIYTLLAASGLVLVWSLVG